MFFFGCSATYHVSDFPSKEKFCEDINNFAKNEYSSIILRNDSLFSNVDNIKIIPFHLIIIN